MSDLSNMHDMGEEREQMTVAEGGKETKEKTKHYPTTYVSSEKIPEIEDFEVGDEVEVVSVNKIIGKNIREKGDKKTTEVTLEIKKMGVIYKGDKKKQREMGVDGKRFKEMKEKGMT